MGGRVAEELVYGEMTNGASNDIERATDLARNMVCNWGMSERLGPINYAKQNAGPMYGGESVSFSDDTSRKIDMEIANFVQKNYEVSKRILQDNMEVLHRLTEALVLWETLDADQIRDIVAGKDIGAPVMSKKPTDIPPSGTVVGANPLFGAGKPTTA
jgi:cell division protease FtsH